jgi:hypothetical protein
LILFLHPIKEKADVKPFIKDPTEIDIWTTDYFLDIDDRIRYK